MGTLNRLITTTALLLAATAFVKADPIDPIFDMGDPGIGLPISSTTFSFSSNANGGGFLSFMNESQLDWTGLAVQAVQPTGSIISCSGGPFFSDCLISSIPQADGSSIFTLSLLLRTKVGGILNGEFFTIGLNDRIGGAQPPDPSGSGGWGPNTSFTAQVTDFAPSVPEPATWALLLGGLAMVGSLKLLRKGFFAN